MNFNDYILSTTLLLSAPYYNNGFHEMMIRPRPRLFIEKFTTTGSGLTRFTGRAPVKNSLHLSQETYSNSYHNISTTTTIMSTKLHQIPQNDLICQEVRININNVGEIIILEATAESQETLVNSAIDDDENKFYKAQLQSEDPYGAVLWPSSSAVANILASEDLTDRTILELGAGTGLVSIAVTKAGAKSVQATDYEAVPLQILEYSLQLNNINNKNNNNNINNISNVIKCSLFDICRDDMALPDADIVAAADIMYEPATGKAMARRAYEALQRNSRVLVGCSPGRAGRPAFLEELRKLLDNQSIDFTDSLGYANISQGIPPLSAEGEEEGVNTSSKVKPVKVDVLDLRPEHFF